jgi:hypothetical protein
LGLKADVDKKRTIDRAAAAPVTAPAGSTTRYAEGARKNLSDPAKDGLRREAKAADQPVKAEPLYRQLASMKPAERDAYVGGLERQPEAALKALPALKPAERRRIIRALKLAAPLHPLLGGSKTAASGDPSRQARPEVKNGRALVQVWVAGLTAANLRTLKALGFQSAGELKPKQLVLGSIAVSQLDRLTDLPFVAYVDVPKFVQ